MSYLRMIELIVGRCHVGSSYQGVIRIVIGRFTNGFEDYRNMATADKATFIKMVMDVHDENRGLFNTVMGAM